MTNWRGNGGGWGVDAPVYDADYDDIDNGSTNPYPDVWITEQRWTPSSQRTGRSYVWHYAASEDRRGEDALYYGASYYNEGMSCADEGDEHGKRIMCFQAAELLYLHAAYKGNPYGHLNLGYVYSYDRCEGRYWKDFRWPDDYKDPSPDEKALMHFRAAAQAGIAEACYKYGDMLRDGRGCEINLDEAFAQFKRAYELGTQKPVIWGSAALRLGRAYEEGEGCEQSFEQALEWYKRATAGLDTAVRSGESWYNGALTRAERGLARVRQELSGTY